MSDVHPALRHVPTMAEIEAERRGKPLTKGKTRLEETEAEKKLTYVDDKAFRADVFKLDKGKCRCCGRKVERVMERVAKRAEVHHVHGRRGSLRFEVRAALLLCLQCHEKCTGKVQEKCVIVATVTFDLQMKDGLHTFTNAREKVTFQRVA